MYVQHSLMDDRVAACLANHKISPLHDNDRHEKRRVTCKLEHLALSIRLPNNGVFNLRIQEIKFYCKYTSS